MEQKDNLFLLSREEARQMGASDFNHGDTVLLGKWRIHVKYKNGQSEFPRPSMLTTVSTRYDLRDQPMYLWPHYVNDFIHR